MMEEMGTGIKKLDNGGFALMEVLMLLMIFLIFLTSLFASAKFRNQAAMRKVQKEEAICAAEAAVELMAEGVLNGTSSFIDHGMKKMETWLVFEADDGRERVRIPVTIWAERTGEKLKLYAEAEVGERKETASMTLYCKTEFLVATDSSSRSAATASNAGVVRWSMEEGDGT